MLYFLVFHFIPHLLSQNKAFHSELGPVVPRGTMRERSRAAKRSAEEVAFHQGCIPLPQGHGVFGNKWWLESSSELYFVGHSNLFHKKLCLCMGKKSDFSRLELRSCLKFAEIS